MTTTPSITALLATPPRSQSSGVHTAQRPRVSTPRRGASRWCSAGCWTRPRILYLKQRDRSEDSAACAEGTALRTDLHLLPALRRARAPRPEHVACGDGCACGTMALRLGVGFRFQNPHHTGEAFVPELAAQKPEGPQDRGLQGGFCPPPGQSLACSGS